MRQLLLFIIIWLISISSQAQIISNGTAAGNFSYARTFQVSGNVVDTANHAFIPFAHLTFISGKDTTRMAANQCGQFIYEGRITDEMEIRVTCIGYKPVNTKYYPKKQGIRISIVMEIDVQEINTVVVTGNTIAIISKGDTIQYNATAFKTLESDWLESLIKKMPGLKLDKEGLKFNGEPVRIRIDGKAIFGESGIDALTNIKADNVEHIQVYDIENEEDKKIGMKNPRKHKEMNVKTKNKADIYRNSDITAGSGQNLSKGHSLYKTKWDIQGRYHYFYEKERFKLDGLHNNLPRKIADAPSESQLSTVYFTYENEKNKKLKYYTTNTFHNDEKYNIKSTTQEYFPTKDFNSRTFNNAQRDKHFLSSGKTKHRINLTIGDISCEGEFAYEFSNSRMRKYNNSTVILDANTVASTSVKDYNKIQGSNFSGKIRIAEIRVGKSKRIFITPTLQFDLFPKDANGWRMDTLLSSTNRIYIDNYGKERNTHVNGSIMIMGRLFPLINTQLNYSIRYTDISACRTAIDLFTENIDSTNTFDYTIHTLKQNIATFLTYQGKKTSVSLSPGVSFFHRTHNEHFPQTIETPQNYCFFEPQFHFSYRFSNTTNVKIEYFLNHNMPSIENIRGTIDNANPLILQAGDPNLKTPTAHSVRFTLNSMNIRAASSISLQIESNVTHNPITSSSQYFTENTYLPKYDYTALKGATLYTPTNVGTESRLYLRAFYNKLLKLLQSNLNVSLNCEYLNIPQISQEKRNDIETKSGRLNISLKSNFSRRVEITIGGGGSLNLQENSTGNNSKLVGWNTQNSIRADITKKYRLTALYNYSYQKDKKGYGQKIDYQELNATLTRKLGKKGSIVIGAYNLLDSGSKLGLRMYNDYISRTDDYRAGRYLIFSFKYVFIE